MSLLRAAARIMAALASYAMTGEKPAARKPPASAAPETAVPDTFIALRPDFSVSRQLSAADVAAAAAQGYTLIVNNRPDGEMFGQPKGAEIEAAARAAGIAYVHIPVDGRGLTMDHISALKNAIKDAGGRTLAYCASGTRSTYLQAFLAASEGRAADEIIAEAAAAGYDISGARRTLEALRAAQQEDESRT